MRGISRSSNESSNFPAPGSNARRRILKVTSRWKFLPRLSRFRYLERATDETFIRKQDFAELLIKIAMNPVGLDVAWNFVRYRSSFRY